MCKISAKEKNKAGKGVRSLNRVTFEPTHEGGEGGQYLALRWREQQVRRSR